jgi:hypothetical protein
VDLATDTNHCGACGTACGLIPNGNAACTGGTCTVASCNANFGDCDLQFSDGCEANLLSDPIHCGTCGTACGLTPNTAATVCGLAACRIAACQPGWFDIDGLYVDGCECKAPTASQSCATATNLGTLAAGQTINYSDTVLPGSELYLTVAFTYSDLVHPRVSVQSSTGAPVVFDVLTDCGGGTFGCGTEGGVSIGDTFWEIVDTHGSMPFWTPTAIPASVIVRVRPTASACGAFTLAISG